MEHELTGSDSKRFRRILGTPSLTLFGLAYMVPLGIFTTYGIVTVETSGHLPTAYVITVAAMLFTAASYAKMVKLIPSAGSAYTYARRAFGSRSGFMVGWALLLDYLLLPMVNYLVIGLYLHEAFPAVDNRIWILAAIALTTVINILGLRIVVSANMILLAVQLVFIVIFVALCARSMFTHDVISPLDPFMGSELSLSHLAAGAAILVFSFLGFDAISTLSEDAKNSTVTVPRAIMLSTLIAGGLAITIAYAGHMVFPNWQQFTNVDAAALDVIGAVGGAFMVAFFTAAYIVGCFASATVSQTSVARLLYAMGRDQVLPNSLFGRLHIRFNTPVRGLLVIAAISLIALFISLSLASQIISFGALVAFTVTNLTVIKCYILGQKRTGGADLVRYLLLPLIGAALTGWLWTSLSNDALIVGLVWTGVGFVYLLSITRMFRQRLPETSFELEDPSLVEAPKKPQPDAVG